MKQISTLKLCLGLFLALTVLTVAAVFSFAQPAITEVGNEEELRAAVANGGEIRLINDFQIVDIETGIAEPIVVEKDVVLDLNGHVIELTTPGADSLFTVSGASLTVNGIVGSNSFLGYNGGGSVFKIVGVEGKETSLTVNYAQVYARLGGEFQNPSRPIGIISIEAEGTATVPTATINDGRFFCENEMASYFGPIVAGKTEALTVAGGSFGVDPSDYLAEHHEAIRDWDNYLVLPIAQEYSDAFREYLDENGKFVLNYYQPEEGESLDPLFEALWMTEDPLYFYTSTLNEEDYSIYVSLYDRESGDILETHKVNFVFNCNPALRQIVKDIIDLIPEDPEGYYFTTKDMELINYWMSMNSEREYSGSLMQYSGEFRELVDYKNFSLDPRMGWDTPFYTEYFGPGNFMHDGVVYGMKEIGVKAQHILYVPDNTPNTRQDLIAAAQARIDEYLGGNSGVTVAYADTAEECYYRWYFEYCAWEWEEDLPDVSYEDWKQSSYFPVISDQEIEDCSGIPGITLADDCFQVEINGICHYLFILPDSSNMVSPTCKTADAVTNVTVSATDPTLPLDTMIEIEKLTDGTEYERILEILEIETEETFDIKLHSQSLNQYITTLDNGTFEVRIPLSDEWDGKDPTVYYVDENGLPIEHEVTLTEEKDWAIFVTNHFSIYTLAEKQSTENDSTNTGSGSGSGTNTETDDATSGGAGSGTTSDGGTASDGNGNAGTNGTSSSTGNAGGGANAGTSGSGNGAGKPSNPSTSGRSGALAWTGLLVAVAITAAAGILLKQKNS